MIVGTYEEELEPGEIVEVCFRPNLGDPETKAAGRVIRKATREEYIAEIKAEGRYEVEKSLPTSVMRNSRLFYLVHVD